jgi:acetylornithine deacetylase
MKKAEKILAELVKINSVNDKEITDFISIFLSKCGADIIFQKFGDGKINVIAKFGKPKTVLVCHHDTVPVLSGWLVNPFTLKKKDGKLYGLGACDVKGSMAAILAALANYPKLDSLNLMVLFTSSEETGLIGIKEFVKSDYAEEIQFGIVSEPTELKVITAHKGYCKTNVQFFGKNTHSSCPWKGVNAIVAAAKFIAELDKKYSYQKKKVDGSTPTINIAVINGGIKGNIVPNKCIVSISKRTSENDSVEKIAKELSKIAKKHSKKVIIEISEFYPALDCRNKSIIKLLKKCGATKVGRADFMTEAGILSSFGIDSVVFGPGSIRQAHKANEYISRSELDNGEKIYSEILDSIKGI